MLNLFRRLRILLSEDHADQDFFDEGLPAELSVPSRFSVLRITSTQVKAVIVEMHDGYVEVLGAGRYPQNYTQMSEGIVIDIGGVIANCNEALLRAEQEAGGVAPAAVIGIAGELVKGNSVTVSKQRPNPSKPITADELDQFISIAHNKLLKNAQERIAAETSLQNIDVDLTQAEVVSVCIDGYTVKNPISFRGRNFSLTLFGTFAPLIQLKALETVAQGLDLTLFAFMAENYVLADRLSTNTSTDSGAIFIHVGDSATDITFTRQGGTERTFGIGIRDFIRKLASCKGISLKDARKIVSLYGKSEISGNEREEVKTFLQPEVQTWMDSAELLIDELAQGELLPPAIYICGEDIVLPDLLEALWNFPWLERLQFAHTPIVRIAEPGMIQGLSDPKDLLQSSDVLLAALARDVVAIRPPDNSFAQIVREVIMKMDNSQAFREREENKKSTPSKAVQLQANVASIKSVRRNDANADRSNRADSQPKRPVSPQKLRIAESYTNTSGKRATRSLNVFLCHSTSDKTAVRSLYSRLKADGFNPWLDEEKLLPGQDWNFEIQKAVRNSDIVIVCLSHESVQKSGYIQKEIKYALDVADEQPEGTIFLIPLKLEECTIPARLSRWQWVNFFEDIGYRRLIMALQARAEELLSR